MVFRLLSFCTFCALSVNTPVWSMGSNTALDRILLHGELHIGVDPHNPPVSVQLINGRWQGFSIDMAKKFAGYLHIKAIFIPETYETVEKQLQRHDIDIDMNGIESDDTTTHFFLASKPILDIREIALMPCPVVDKISLPFYSEKELFMKMNNRKMHIIIAGNSPAQKKLSRLFDKAHITIMRNKEQAYQRIKNHDADVLIIDNIYARLLIHNSPGLCIANPFAAFTHTDSVYLINQLDINLQQRLNTWITKTNIASIAAHWF